MIIIKGLITFKKQSVLIRIKLFFGFIKKEFIYYNNKEVIKYILPEKFKKRYVKRLSSDLKKLSIKDILILGKNEKYVSSLESEFNIINCKKIMLNLIDKIILKAIKMLGIKDGKLSLGIMAFDSDLDILAKLKSLKNSIKCIYLYCKSDLAEESGDEFYESTGISVIKRDIVKEDQIDILIYLNGTQKEFPSDLSFIVDLSDKNNMFNIKTINDLKLKMPYNLMNLKIKDIEFNELFECDFPIKSFVIKNT